MHGGQRGQGVSAVDRGVEADDREVVVFGAGPIGLGAVIGYRLSGAESVVVVDLLAAEVPIVTAMGCPDEIFHVAEGIAAHREKFD